MTIELAQGPYLAIAEPARARALTGDPAAEDPARTRKARATATPSAISGGSDASLAATAEQIEEALRDVLDPELGMSVVDLGLIYGIEVGEGAVTISMTLTAPGCPIHDAMANWVRQAARKVPGVSAVEVNITFDPPWTPERIKLPSGPRT